VRALALLTALGASACVASEAVSPPPLGDYTSWHRVDTWGPAPGHGDSYRIIYVNDVARGFTGGQYPEGSVLVKEIRARTADGAPGDLSYVGIMRRIGPPTEAYADEAGWLFSKADEPGGAETYFPFCWERCHQAAPFAGAWLDYGLD